MHYACNRTHGVACVFVYLDGGVLTARGHNGEDGVCGHTRHRPAVARQHTRWWGTRQVPRAAHRDNHSAGEVRNGRTDYKIPNEKQLELCESLSLFQDYHGGTAIMAALSLALPFFTRAHFHDHYLACGHYHTMAVYPHLCV